MGRGFGVVDDADPKSWLPVARTHVSAWAFQQLVRRANSAKAGWPRIVKTDPCVYCNNRGKRKKRTREHITPASLGGGRQWFNIAGACGICQKERANHPIPFFLFHRMERLKKEGQLIGGVQNGVAR